VPPRTPRVSHNNATAPGASERASTSSAGTPVSTAAARLLGADAGGVFSRVDAGTLTALHSSGWPAATAGQFTHLEIRRGRPAALGT
jgi:hypothetical protein